MLDDLIRREYPYRAGMIAGVYSDLRAARALARFMDDAANRGGALYFRAVEIFNRQPVFRGYDPAKVTS